MLSCLRFHCIQRSINHPWLDDRFPTGTTKFVATLSHDQKSRLECHRSPLHRLEAAKAENPHHTLKVCRADKTRFSFQCLVYWAVPVLLFYRRRRKTRKDLVVCTAKELVPWLRFFWQHHWHQWNNDLDFLVYVAKLCIDSESSIIRA